MLDLPGGIMAGRRNRLAEAAAGDGGQGHVAAIARIGMLTVPPVSRSDERLPCGIRGSRDGDFVVRNESAVGLGTDFGRGRLR